MTEESENGETVVDGDTNDVGMLFDPMMEWPILGSTVSVDSTRLEPCFRRVSQVVGKAGPCGYSAVASRDSAGPRSFDSGVENPLAVRPSRS